MCFDLRDSSKNLNCRCRDWRYGLRNKEQPVWKGLNQGQTTVFVTTLQT